MPNEKQFVIAKPLLDKLNSISTDIELYMSSYSVEPGQTIIPALILLKDTEIDAIKSIQIQIITLVGCLEKRINTKMYDNIPVSLNSHTTINVNIDNVLEVFNYTDHKLTHWFLSEVEKLQPGQPLTMLVMLCFKSLLDETTNVLYAYCKEFNKNGIPNDVEMNIQSILSKIKSRLTFSFKYNDEAIAMALNFYDVNEIVEDYLKSKQ